MVITTLRKRATTLSKALLTVAILGGASLSTLGAGSAQAATGWVFESPNGYGCVVGPSPGSGTCDFTGTDPTPTPVNIPGFPFGPSDKILTLLGQNGLLAGDAITFVKLTPSDHSYWRFSLDFATAVTANGSGNVDYMIQIIDPSRFFHTAELTANIGGSGPYTITKKFFTDSTFTTEILPWRLSAPPVPVIEGIGDQIIYVRDNWSVPNGSGISIDNIDNKYTQVPAPLPILGIGAAFGFSRRLRKRIKASKTPDLISALD